MFSLDPALPEDVANVLESSACLEISEFRVFELAYAAWFGREPEQRVIEAYFGRYMYQAIVPPWVRHFTRRVCTLQHDGLLDPRAYGILPRELSRREVARGRLYIAYLVASLVVLLLLAELTVDWLDIRGCMLPPCY